MSQIDRYLDEHAVDIPESETLPSPSSELRASVVIPAYDERETIETVIDSLAQTATPPAAFELIVAVNNPTDAPSEAREANRATIALLEGREEDFPIHVIDRATEGAAFPADDAGVGRARRLAMDLAVRRLAEAGVGSRGVIPCLDGDSPPAPGYLDAILEAFGRADGQTHAGVCRHRHPIPGRPEHARAIVAYETWMRYFELGMHLAETPYAYQAIGSCMVLTAGGYALADGVPPREALSDFYLLQKIAKVGGRGAVAQLEEPLVYPSARPSERVPRGTGPSVRHSIEASGETRFEMVEPPSVFIDLQAFFSGLEEGFANPHALRSGTPRRLADFIERWDGWRTLEKLRTHAPGPAHFARHVHQWFDGLKIVKYANRCSRRGSRVGIFRAVRRLLEAHGRPEIAGSVPDAAPESASLDQRRTLLELLRDHELDFHPTLL